MNREVPEPLSLRRNFSWTVLGEVTYAGCQWAMLVVLAKLGTPELLGRFSLGLAVTAPLFMFTNLQLRQLQATDATPEGSFAPYFTLRLLCTAMAVVILGVVASLYSGDLEIRAGILLLGLAKGVEAVSDIFCGRLQQLGNLNLVSLSLILKGVLSLAAVAAGVYWTQHLAPVCLLLLVTWLVVLLAVEVPFVTRAGIRRPGQARNRWRYTFALCWEASVLKRLLLLGLPLGLTAMLISLNVSLPRFVLEQYWQEHAVGVYAALASLMALSNLPAIALGTAASPRLGYCAALRDRTGLRNLLARLLGVSFLFGAAGFVLALGAGRFLLRVFYSAAIADYAESPAAFVWLMLAATGANLCFILNWATVAARYVNVQIPLHLGLLVVMAAACYGWVPSWGVVGAAWAVVAASACQVAGTVTILVYAVRSWPKAA
jgi:O-antigen/teichoic acid export membrane protein